MELREYLDVLRKRWRLVTLSTLLALAAAVFLTASATPQYRSGVKFFVAAAPTDAPVAGLAGADLGVQRSIVSYADVLAGPFTAEAVARAVPGLAARDVQGHISAKPVASTVLLSAVVTDASPQRALAIASALTTEFPKIVAQLESRADGLTPAISVRVTEQPQLPTTPFSPRPIRNLLLSLILGVLAGVGLAVARETLDNTVHGPADVLESTGGAILGSIAFDGAATKRPLIVQDRPRAPRAEAFRQLRTNLQFISVDRPLRSFVISSSLPKEGKSTMACNLAITLAQAGVRTCLIEGDLRRPRVADYLGLEGAVGLTSVLIGRASLEEVLQPWGESTMSVLASGPIPPNPSELLSSAGMRTVLKQLERDFDIVIIDAPPLLPVTDGALLSTMTDGAVLSVRAGVTRKEQLRRAAEALEAVDAKILGVVLNMVPKGSVDAAYGYGYGYGYGGYEADKNKPQMSDEDALLALRSRDSQNGESDSAMRPASPGPADTSSGSPSSEAARGGAHVADDPTAASSPDLST